MKDIDSAIRDRNWEAALRKVEILGTQPNSLQEHISSPFLDEILSGLTWTNKIDKKRNSARSKINKVKLLFEILCLNCSRERVVKLKNALNALLNNIE